MITFLLAARKISRRGFPGLAGLFFVCELVYFVAFPHSPFNFYRHFLALASLGDRLVLNLHGGDLLTEIG